jgi:peptidoglycan hydrolase CwlO-like protein
MKQLNRNHRLAGLMGLALMSAAAEGAAGGAPAAETTPPTPKAPGVGDVAKQLIRDGLGNKEVLEKVREQFPDAKTSMSSINWYRNHLRGLGEDVKTARELSAAGKPTAEQKAAEKAAKAEAKAKEKAEKKEADKKAKAEAKAAEKAAKAAGAQQAPAGQPEQAAGDGAQGADFLA